MTQAAAEYVGVTLQTAMRSIGTGLGSAGRYLEANPVVLVAAVVALLVLVRLLTRKRR